MEQTNAELQAEVQALKEKLEKEIERADTFRRLYYEAEDEVERISAIEAGAW